MHVVREARPVLQRQLALVVRELFLVSLSSSLAVLKVSMELTIEFVNVAGMATVIHHTRPFRKSPPLPLTKLLTKRPSSSATYRLIIVLSTRNTV